MRRRASGLPCRGGDASKQPRAARVNVVTEQPKMKTALGVASGVRQLDLNGGLRRATRSEQPWSLSRTCCVQSPLSRARATTTTTRRRRPARSTASPPRQRNRRPRRPRPRARPRGRLQRPRLPPSARAASRIFVYPVFPTSSSSGVRGYRLRRTAAAAGDGVAVEVALDGPRRRGSRRNGSAGASDTPPPEPGR